MYLSQVLGPGDPFGTDQVLQFNPTAQITGLILSIQNKGWHSLWHRWWCKCSFLQLQLLQALTDLKSSTKETPSSKLPPCVQVCSHMMACLVESEKAFGSGCSVVWMMWSGVWSPLYCQSGAGTLGLFLCQVWRYVSHQRWVFHRCNCVTGLTIMCFFYYFDFDFTEALLHQPAVTFQITVHLLLLLMSLSKSGVP